jgi:glycosyltransferase involved in cell wall biosynthesis
LVLNSPDDERLFVRREHHTSRGEADRFRIVTHGTLIERYGVQVLLAALPKIAEDVPGVEVDVYGDGEYRDELQAQARKLGIANRVRFWGFVPYVELPGRLSEADLAYAGPLVDLLVANKMLEYEALGIPMVLARWPALQDHFPDECVAYVTHGDADELARAVVELYRHPDRAQAMAARASNHYQASHRWALQRSAYLQLFEDAPAVLSRVPAREDTLTLA